MKVYFDGNFWGHSGRDHAGKELSIEQEFTWAGRLWRIPAVYLCSKGLAADFCMRVDPREIRAFMERWNLTAERNSCSHFTEEQIMQIDAENPLAFDFSPHFTANGHVLRAARGCGLCYNPCLPEMFAEDKEVRQVMESYNLDPSFGWLVYRSCALWKTKRRPALKTLSLTMQQPPASVPGPHFRVHKAGDTFSFTEPESEKEHTLTVLEYGPQILPPGSFPTSRTAMEQEFPSRFFSMTYTITPELPDGCFSVSDCAGSDKPRYKQADAHAPAASGCAAIGIIGGTDGPTTVTMLSSGHAKQHTACSALHFEPAEQIEWRIVFRRKLYADETWKLL